MYHQTPTLKVTGSNPARRTLKTREVYSQVFSYFIVIQPYVSIAVSPSATLCRNPSGSEG